MEGGSNALYAMHCGMESLPRSFKDYPLDVTIKITMLIPVEQIRTNILSLLLPLGVRRVALFGSIVRGEVGPTSDIDILVTLKPPSERSPIGLKWFNVEAKLSTLLGRSVDLVAEEALSPYLRPYIEKELIVIYEER